MPISIYFVFIIALVLEALGSFIAILGFADKAGFLLISVLVCLDLAKIIIATVLYKNWEILSLKFKVFLLPSLLVLMSFTSGGAFGYVSKEFTKILLPQEQNNIALTSMQRERDKLELRKKEIDSQINRVPDGSPTAKRRLMEAFSSESNEINSKISELDKNILLKETEISKFTADGGTILSVSKTLNIPPENVIKYFAGLITLFLDPLAIVLLTLGNFLLAHKEKQKNIKTNDQELTIDNKNLNSLKNEENSTNNPNQLNPENVYISNSEQNSEIKNEVINNLPTEETTEIVNEPLEDIAEKKKYNKKRKIEDSNISLNKNIVPASYDQINYNNYLKNEDILDSLSILNNKEENNKHLQINVSEQNTIISDNIELENSITSNEVVNLETFENNVLEQSNFVDVIDINQVNENDNLQEISNDINENNITSDSEGFDLESSIAEIELNSVFNQEIIGEKIDISNDELLPTFKVENKNGKKPFFYDFSIKPKKSVKNDKESEDLDIMNNFIKNQEQTNNKNYDEDPI